MNYTEAIAAADEGKKVSRRGWGSYFGWYHITSYKGEVTMNDPCNGMSTIIRSWYYEPTEADKNAVDWEIIEEIRKWR